MIVFGRFRRWFALFVVLAFALLLIESQNSQIRMTRFSFFATLAGSLSFAFGQHSWDSENSWGHPTGTVSAYSAPQSAASASEVSTSAASTYEAASSTAGASGATYTNPILSKVGADPWVIRSGDYYYMTYTTNDNVTLLRSSVLTFVHARS